MAKSDSRAKVELARKPGFLTLHNVGNAWRVLRQTLRVTSVEEDISREVRQDLRNLSDREWGGDVRTLVPTSFVTGEGAGFVILFEG